jgi:mannose-6-phosphate isomerase-like protein (cupin superfamily)
MSKPFTLDTTYVNLRPDDSATTIKLGPRFWDTIDKRTDLDDGRLMGSTPQITDWLHWERHSGGDEVLVMLSGEMDIVLETRAGERRTRLKEGQAFVVPRGVWHRGLARKPGMLIFITPGAGTEHRPLVDDDTDDNDLFEPG